MTSTNPDKYTENFWLSFAELTYAGITKGREWCATVSYFEEFKQRLYDLKNSGSSLPSDSSRRKHPHVPEAAFATATATRGVRGGGSGGGYNPMDFDEQLSYVSGDSSMPAEGCCGGYITGLDYYDNHINGSYYVNVNYGVPQTYNTKQPRMKRRETEAEVSFNGRNYVRSRRSSSYCSGDPDADNASKNGRNRDNNITAIQNMNNPSALKAGHIIKAPISNYSNIKELSSFTVYTVQNSLSTDPKYLLTPMQQPQSHWQKQQQRFDDRKSDPLYCFVKRELPNAPNEFIDKQLQILLSEGVFGLSSLCVSVKNQTQWSELERKLDPKLCDAIVKNFSDSPQQQQYSQRQASTSPKTLPATPSAFELIDGSAVSSPSFDFSAASGTISKCNESVLNEGSVVDERSPRLREFMIMAPVAQPSFESQNNSGNMRKHLGENTNSNSNIRVPQITELFAVDKKSGTINNRNNSINNFDNNNNSNTNVIDEDEERKSYDDDDTKSICLDETF